MSLNQMNKKLESIKRKIALIDSIFTGVVALNLIAIMVTCIVTMARFH